MYKRNNRGKLGDPPTDQYSNITKGYKRYEIHKSTLLALVGCIGSLWVRHQYAQALPKPSHGSSGREHLSSSRQKEAETLPLVGSNPPPVHVSTRNIRCLGSGIPTYASICRWNPGRIDPNDIDGEISIWIL